MIVRVVVGLLVFLFAPLAYAEPVRILIAAGNKQGLPAERPLKFADADAKHVRDVLVSLGGVRSEHAFYLAEPTRATLFSAVDRARVEAQRHRSDEVTLLFYFSGHGDREALHLAGDRVLVTELSQKLGEVPAALRIAVTDACRATREKGFAADEPFAISPAVLPQATGQVWLHASSDGEAAQESDELQGAIFTHAWLSGLRGAADANGDARVTLDESFAFAHSQTLIRSSKSSGVTQKPEAVIQLREAAPVVITQTTARMSTLSLPQARDAHFLVYSAAAKSVLSELWGSPERRLAIKVPPGRYVVQRRIAGAGAVATIALAEGEERRLEAQDFSVSPLEALARKGDFVEVGPRDRPGPHELAVGWDAGGDSRTGFSHGPRAGYAYAWSRFALSIGGALAFADRTVATPNETESEALTSGFGRAGFEARFPLGARLVLRAGSGARAGVVSQRLAGETKNAFAIGPEVMAAARMGLGRSFFVDAGATGGLVFVSEAQSLRGIFGLSGTLALGTTLGR
ncbi:MAG: caspase family protein [Labilithrix sp.]|nr:caspase family protein [Labilithrix sp.]MCW5811060.1 caspase family protein [Labilithrix sp.]